MGAQHTAAARTALREASNDLLAYFVRRVPSREDAADLYGETMLTAWKRIDKLPDEPERQRMWLFVIASHTLSNHRRTAHRRLDLTARLRDLIATAPSAPDPEGAYAVRDAVLRLPQPQRELVMLVHWDGFTITEAAELAGVNPSTARSRYAAARVALRDALVDAES
ncbi:sigma-70 family RNA polymerase sigma factor [Nocardioides sp. W7]|uniref:RNA polymerase sigma factor n=1 Tax=Nocardioides sp. W7 TaxID=2931390 RepID=UPI001FD17387|nr:sigma-70 family RNA polymerase sigma factor [Nocardioides sp. W7]